MEEVESSSGMNRMSVYDRTVCTMKDQIIHNFVAFYPILFVQILFWIFLARFWNNTFVYQYTSFSYTKYRKLFLLGFHFTLRNLDDSIDGNQKYGVSNVYRLPLKFYKDLTMFLGVVFVLYFKTNGQKLNDKEGLNRMPMKIINDVSLTLKIYFLLRLRSVRTDLYTIGCIHIFLFFLYSYISQNIRTNA